MAKGRILIVEDSYMVACHLQQTVELQNFSAVGIVDSAEGAIAACEESKPDLVFMDIMLTGKMDGIDAAGVIQKRFEIPVVFITALTDKPTLQRAVQTQPYGYLKKPFEDDEVVAILHRVFH